MERIILWSVVALVGAIGVMAAISGPTITGDVIDSTCECASTSPVCAAKDGKLTQYPSSCHAQCDEARIVHENACATIPRV